MRDLSLLLEHINLPLTTSGVEVNFDGLNLSRAESKLLKQFLLARPVNYKLQVVLYAPPSIPIENIQIFWNGAKKFLFEPIDIKTKIDLYQTYDSVPLITIDSDQRRIFNVSKMLKLSSTALIVDADYFDNSLSKCREDVREIGGNVRSFLDYPANYSVAVILNRVLTEGCFRDGSYVEMNEQERIGYAQRVMAHELYHSIFGLPDMTPKEHLEMGSDDKKCLSYSRFDFEARFCDNCIDLMRATLLARNYKL